jgi:hypothetical protein
VLEFSDVAVAHPIQPAVRRFFFFPASSNPRGHDPSAGLDHRRDVDFLSRLVWFLRDIYVATVSRRIGAR